MNRVTDGTCSCKTLCPEVFLFSWRRAKETTTPSEVGRALHQMDRIYVFQLTQPYHLYRHVHEQSVIETRQICLKTAIFNKGK